MSRHKNQGVRGHRLSDSTIRIYAHEFLQWRKQQGGAVANMKTGRILDRVNRKFVDGPPRHSDPLDRIVHEMGAGRMWGSDDYE